MSALYTIPMTDVKTQYARVKPDGHWFDAGSMRFFKTRLPRSARLIRREVSPVCFFISRETDPSYRTRYTIRCMDWTTGGMESVGRGFHSYGTRREAADDMNLIISDTMAFNEV